MKPRRQLPKFKNNNLKPIVYSTGLIKDSHYDLFFKKSLTINLAKCCKTPKYYMRKRKDREFNKLINNYYDDYNKFSKKHQFKPKVTKKKEDNFDTNYNYNKYEIKKKTLGNIFFAYDSKINADPDYNITDNLINSMYNENNDTLIKSTAIKYDYEMRLNGFKKKKEKKKPQKYNNYLKEEDKNEIHEFKEEVTSGDQSSSKKDFKVIKEKKEEEKEEKEEEKEKEEEEEEDDNINYLKNGDIDIDDNYLKFRDNSNSDTPLLKDILNKDFNSKYQPPKYIVPQSVLDEEEENKRKAEEMQNLYNLQKNQTLNKYKDGELKRFQDIIKDNEYPCFEQLTNPYYQTSYIPPPCFPKMPEDEEESENELYGYGDFGFTEDNKEIEDEDEDQLILLSNQINNKEFPMFEHLIRNDFKGYYAPPLYKIPSHIEKSIQKEKEKKQKEKEENEKNKANNVLNDINQYDNKELKMLSNIIKSDEYPKFEQLIDPYYQTNYIPPEVFPKPQDLVEKEEEEQYGYGEFELVTEKVVEGNEDEDILVLLNKAVLNNEYPMFNNLISSDFKGNYAPPIYKIPESMKEENKNIAEENRKHFNEMKGTYMDPNNYEGEFPTVAKMVDKDFNN